MKAGDRVRVTLRSFVKGVSRTYFRNNCEVVGTRADGQYLNVKLPPRPNKKGKPVSETIWVDARDCALERDVQDAARGRS